MEEQFTPPQGWFTPQAGFTLEAVSMIVHTGRTVHTGDRVGSHCPDTLQLQPMLAELRKNLSQRSLHAHSMLAVLRRYVSSQH